MQDVITENTFEFLLGLLTLNFLHIKFPVCMLHVLFLYYMRNMILPVSSDVKINRELFDLKYQMSRNTELMTYYHFHQDLKNYLDLVHLLSSS